MGVTTFSLFRIASSLETADEKRSVFSGYILDNPALLKATGLSIVTIVLATELGILQNVLGMISLTGEQWLICIGVALTLIVVEEVKKALKISTGTEPSRRPLRPPPQPPRTVGPSPGSIKNRHRENRIQWQTSA